MSKTTGNYGERVCLECGKKFNATYLQQVTCSDECKRARNLARKRACSANRWPRHKEMVNKLKAENTQLHNELSDALAELNTLRAQNEKMQQIIQNKCHTNIEKNAIPKSTGKGKEWCERLKLKADELPCGQRPECFANPICDKAV